MRRFLASLIGGLITVIALAANVDAGGGNLVFMVLKEGNKADSKLKVYIDWPTILGRKDKIDKERIAIIDMDNNKPVKYELIDTNRDGKPDGVYFVTGLNRSERIRTFELTNQGKKANAPVVSCKVPVHDSLKITYLTNCRKYIEIHGEPVRWTEKVAQSIISTYPDPADLEEFSKGKWSYTNGFFQNALFEIYEKYQNSEYLKYMKDWADLFVTRSGQLDSSKYAYEIFELDNILPGRLLIWLYQKTGDVRYRKAADQLTNQLNHQPRTSDGGFWHKKVYTDQMWLDGIYMADVFLAQYGSAFKQPQYVDEAIRQMELIYKHTADPNTGLLYHGWNESRNLVWANPKTGASPEFWGRAVGWYIMALVDGLDYIPDDHPEREKLLKIFRDLSASLARYQDKTGMWFQVIDKGDRPDNWVESSGTAMFAYAFAKGYAKGYLGKEYLRKAQKAFEGLQNEIYFDDEGKFYLTGTVKVGTLNPKVSKGDYDYYVGVDRRTNDFKGVAAFMYLSLALESIKK
jgi:unsaturated rhamnogalacturonyl hydrolase